MIRSLAPALFLALAACSTTPANNDVIADMPVAMDMGPDEGVDRCGALPPTVVGAPLTADEVTTAIGAQMGGDVLDGKYILTQIKRYADATRPQTIDRSTIEVRGLLWDFAFGAGGVMANQPRYKRTTLPMTNGSATFEGRCGETSGISLSYTVNGNKLTVVFESDLGVELIYTKQP